MKHYLHYLRKIKFIPQWNFLSNQHWDWKLTTDLIVYTPIPNYRLYHGVYLSPNLHTVFQMQLKLWNCVLVDQAKQTLRTR